MRLVITILNLIGQIKERTRRSIFRWIKEINGIVKKCAGFSLSFRTEVLFEGVDWIFFSEQNAVARAAPLSTTILQCRYSLLLLFLYGSLCLSYSYMCVCVCGCGCAVFNMKMFGSLKSLKSSGLAAWQLHLNFSLGNFHNFFFAFICPKLIFCLF